MEATTMIPASQPIWDVSALPLGAVLLLTGVWIVVTLGTGKARVALPPMRPFVARRAKDPLYYWGAIVSAAILFIIAAGFGILLQTSL
jgi:hypothetical protein